MSAMSTGFPATRHDARWATGSRRTGYPQPASQMHPWKRGCD